MRPDFLLHLIVTIVLFATFTRLFGLQKALWFTLIIQVGKEVFDYVLDNTNIDPTDWLGDALGLLVGLIISKIKMKKKLSIAIIAVILSLSLFAQGGFPAVNPTPLPNGTIVMVHPPGQNSTAVPLDSLIGIRPYKVYTALLSQTGIEAPVATVLENTLGGKVVWTRDDVGVYFGTLSGAFPENKCIPYSFTSPHNWNSYTSATERNDVNSIVVSLEDGTDSPIDISTLGFLLSVEIRVYP